MKISNSHYYTILILLIFLFINIRPLKAKYNFNFKFIPIQSNILPSNEVRKLYQDSDGYIWLPTYNGLARFDGYNIVTYGLHNSIDEPFSLFVNVVVEDNAKNLWIGTEKGIFRLDKQTGMISNINCESLKHSNIATLTHGSNGDLWAGGNHGLFKKSQCSDSFEHIIIKDNAGKEILDITSIIEDSNKNIWIAAWEQGLFKYDIQTRELHSYVDPILKHSHVVFKDNKNSIWVGTWGKGLLKLNKLHSDDKIDYKQYKHNARNENSLLDDIIYAIEQDNTLGHIWIGSRSGLSILHDESELNSFENFTPSDEYGKLPFNEVNSILRTKDNLMWIGMLGGGVCKIQTDSKKYDTNKLKSVREKYKTSSINSIYYIGNDEFWMGIMGFGMIKYNKKTDTFINYADAPDLKSLPYTSTVNSIIKRKKTGEMCFGTWNNGIWFYNESLHQVKMLNSSTIKKFTDNCVNVLMEDSEQNIWIGSRSGIYILDANDCLHTLSEWLNESVDFLSSRIFDIKEDNAKNIWIATNYNGIIKINLRKKKWKQYTKEKGLITNNIFCLLVDSSQHIWTGTIGKGLSYYNDKTDSFVNISSIPNIENKTVSNIIEDNHGRIWITTNNAVLSFTTTDTLALGNINYYSVSNGLQEFFFNKNACLKMPDGKLIFCGSQGIKIIATDKIENQDSPLPLAITDFKIHNQSLRDLPEKTRKRFSEKDIDYTTEITLTHLENNFYIEFSLLNYINPKENIYSYKLEGYDTKRIVTDAQHHFAFYNNLKPGTYIFKLKGANEDGIWSAKEKTLTIHILPAPWLSTGAYLIYIMIALTIMYFIFRFIRYRLRMNHEIQISKLEKQKIEEINHVKLQFFTNITHELMTPLTIIITSLENMKNGNFEKQSLYSIISTNTIRLMRLIQQVLEFRKVESGNLKICVSEGNISSFVKSCIEAFSPLASKKKLHIYFHCHPEIISGYYDSDKLDKIVYNLLSNAAKYTPEGGEIRVKMYLQTDDILNISIMNTGELMNKEQIDHLFQRFYEGDYRKHHTIGTGIGLSLVKDLVNIHRGEIQVASNETTGNCFQITLPINKELYQADEIDESIQNQTLTIFSSSMYNDNEPDKDEENITPQQPDYTILIVDDNEELCMLISNLLSYYFHVEITANGRQALEILKKTNIDLIVSDVMMPEMDGIELCKQVKNQFEYCHIPVILLTAKSDSEYQIEGYNSGADGYISKPFNFPLLYAKIINLLKRQERKGYDFRKQMVFEVDKLNYTSMDKIFIQKAINCVNAHMDDCEFDQTAFVNEMGTSRTTLTEKLKSLTGLTPSAFILNVRLTVACKLMDEQKKIRIADLAYAVGFNDPKYFSTCFKKKYSLSPKEYMEKLQHND